MATALILGAQGTGLAVLLAQAGYWVTLSPCDREAADPQVLHEQVRRSLSRLERAGRLQEGAAACLERVSIEPAAERVISTTEVVFDLLPPAARADFWLAHGGHLTPTSLVAVHSACSAVAETAALIPNPARVLGAYWFSPVELHPLVEVTATPATAPVFVERALAGVKEMGKQPVLSQDGPGRIVNRLLGALVLEAGRILDEELATPTEIDRACRLALGANIGPLGWTDQQGLTAIADLLCAVQPATVLPESLRVRLLAGGADAVARKGI